jgi:hypothetical protein
VGAAVAAAPRQGAEGMNFTVTNLAEVPAYEWFYVIGIALIATLTFVLGTFYKDKF